MHQAILLERFVQNWLTGFITLMATKLQAHGGDFVRDLMAAGGNCFQPVRDLQIGQGLTQLVCPDQDFGQRPSDLTLLYG